MSYTFVESVLRAISMSLCIGKIQLRPLPIHITHVCGLWVIAESYYIANNVYVTMPQAGFEPTEVELTGFQLNAKWMLYLQATTAGLEPFVIFITST